MWAHITLFLTHAIISGMFATSAETGHGRDVRKNMAVYGLAERPERILITGENSIVF
jgi:hypothetical protein